MGLMEQLLLIVMLAGSDLRILSDCTRLCNTMELVVGLERVVKGIYYTNTLSYYILIQLHSHNKMERAVLL